LVRHDCTTRTKRRLADNKTARIDLDLGIILLLYGELTLTV
jgi:hypothetical protein